jgi:hypothetical protein
MSPYPRLKVADGQQWGSSRRVTVAAGSQWAGPQWKGAFSTGSGFELPLGQRLAAGAVRQMCSRVRAAPDAGLGSCAGPRDETPPSEGVTFAS